MNMGGEVIEERREGKKFWKVDWTILLNYNQLSSYQSIEYIVELIFNYERKVYYLIKEKPKNNKLCVKI